MNETSSGPVTRHPFRGADRRLRAGWRLGIGFVTMMVAIAAVVVPVIPVDRADDEALRVRLHAWGEALLAGWEEDRRR